MSGIEFKSFPIEKLTVKADQAGDGRTKFSGYASVFGNEDSYGDVIERGAFTKTLAESAHRVAVLWQHNPSEPIGKPDVMREDMNGLYTEATLSRTSLARDASILLEDKVITELSIGFTPIKWSKRDDNGDNPWGGRSIQEVRLWEYSLVTWAANDLALITGVKDDAEAMLRRSATLLATHRTDTLFGEIRDAHATLEALLRNDQPPNGTGATQEPPPAEQNQETLKLARELRSLVTQAHQL